MLVTDLKVSVRSYYSPGCTQVWFQTQAFWAGFFTNKDQCKERFFYINRNKVSLSCFFDVAFVSLKFGKQHMRRG